jgi:hypothetical protein
MRKVTPPYYVCADRWKGQSVAIIGNGPSLRGRDLSVLSTFVDRVVTTNQSHLLYPDSDMQMCSDRHWLKVKSDWGTYRGPLIIVTRPEEIVFPDPRMRSMRRIHIWNTKSPLANPGILAEGHNSVTTSMSFSTMEGAAKLYLFGVDLAPGPMGERRWDRLEQETVHAIPRYQRMANDIKKHISSCAQRGTTVINCNDVDRLKACEWLPAYKIIGARKR